MWILTTLLSVWFSSTSLSDYYGTIHKHDWTKEKDFDETISHTYVTLIAYMWETNIWICWITYILLNIKLLLQHFILCLYIHIQYMETLHYNVCLGMVKTHFFKYWCILAQIITLLIMWAWSFHDCHSHALLYHDIISYHIYNYMSNICT